MADHSHHHHDHHHHGAEPGKVDTQHGHTDNQAFTEANRAHWNSFASKYTSEPWQITLLSQINTFVRANIPWILSNRTKDSPTYRVLDYACGPGTITHVLGAHASSYTGIDLSENMVHAYNLRFNPDPSTPADESNQIYDADDAKISARAVVGNLLDPSDPSPSDLSGPEYNDFDLVVVGMGFHHFQDIPFATSQLIQRLKPGGTFLILDFVTHAMEGGFDDAKVKHTVAHAGFSEDELKKYYGDAGLTDFSIVKMDEDVFLRGTMRRRLVLARGSKL